MKLVVTHPEPRTRRRWREALAPRLPGARIGSWPPEGGDAPLAEAEFAVGWGPGPEFFDAHRQLRVFFCAGAGVDQLLALPQLPEALTLIRLEDAGMAEQMTAYCSYELMRLDPRHDAYAGQQRAGRWHELAPLEPAEWPVGVFGLGVLGAHLAATLVRLGYPVNGFARTPHAIAGVSCHHGENGLEAFLRASRVLILLAPLTAATRDLFDRERLAMLRERGYLINVARGALVVDADLIAAIDRGSLAGATLDVFRQEPLPSDHPFWQHPAIRVTPHVAAATLVAPGAEQVIEKLRRIAAGEPVSGIVDRTRGY